MARPRACQAARHALQRGHDRDDAPAGARTMGDGAGYCPNAPPGAVGDAPAGERCSARAECGPASAHPRAGSPTRPGLLEFLLSPIYGPTPGHAAGESTTHGTEARRPARTPGHLPRAAA